MFSMTKKPILSPRLKACADFVVKGDRVADIGTDHAYLPIYLVRNGISPHVLACDLKELPLKKARNNIVKHGLSQKIDVRLGDGLSVVSADETDSVVIAGMGGELIARIIASAPHDFRNNRRTNFILQPMSKARSLRVALRCLNFYITHEVSVLDNGYPYTVMRALFAPEKEHRDILYPYIGALDTASPSEATCIYIKHLIKDLKNRLKGCSKQDTEKLEYIISLLRAVLERGCKYG